jgi:hypothetical protein
VRVEKGIECGDLPLGPCAQMGGLALGLLVLVGALAAEGGRWLLGGAPRFGLAFLVAAAAGGLGAPLGLWARAQILAGRVVWPLTVTAALAFALAGATSATSDPASLLLRLSFWGLTAAGGAAWAASGVRRIGMTC